MKTRTLLWMLVPGVGEIQIGRYGKGILLFTVFALLLNAYLLSPLLVSDSVIRMGLLSLTLLSWLIAAVEYARDSSETSSVEARRKNHA